MRNLGFCRLDNTECAIFLMVVFVVGNSIFSLNRRYESAESEKFFLCNFSYGSCVGRDLIGIE